MFKIQLQILTKWIGLRARQKKVRRIGAQISFYKSIVCEEDVYFWVGVTLVARLCFET